jgi:hypothetical protein
VNVPLWVTGLANSFWEMAGAIESFPRQLRSPITRSLPISIVDLSSLRVAGMLEWLRRQHVEHQLALPDQSLHACLVAFVGHGFMFVNADDPADEQRFSIAHELAHFLRDYWFPRKQAREQLGPQIIEVFDGRRPPSAPERLHALVRNVAVGFHIHLLSFDADPVAKAQLVAEIELDADRLAYELLAPAATVAAKASDCAMAMDVLKKVFGLPSQHAAAYAAELFPQLPTTNPLVERLFRKNLSHFDTERGN